MKVFKKAQGRALTNVFSTGLVLVSMSLAASGLGSTFYTNRNLTIATDTIPTDCSDEAAVKAWVIDADETSDEFYKLKKGFCQFYRQSRNPVTNLSEPEAQKLINEAALEDLVDAMDVGLPTAHRSHGLLLEGLLHCRQAMWLWNPSMNDATKEQFCLHRKQGKSSMADVNWRLSRGIFTGTPAAGLSTNPKVTDLISEMTTCHQLSDNPQGFDNSNGQTVDMFCGTQALTADVISGAVQEVLTEKIYPKYLDGSTAPLTAMLERKRQKSTTVLDGSDAAIIELTQKAARVNEQYLEIKGKVDAQKPTADEAVETYKKAVGEFFGVEGAVNEWANSVFDGGTDLKVANTAIDGMGPATVDLASLKDSVSKALSLKKNRRDAVRRMCEVYFCEILSKRHKEHRDSLCHNASFRDQNPLCKERHAQLDSDNGQMYVGQLCQEYGMMDPNYMANGFDADPGSACFNHEGVTTAGTFNPGPESSTSLTKAITLTSFTDYLEGGARTYVALYHNSANDTTTAVRLKSCTKEQSLAMLGITEQDYVDDVFIWESWWAGVYSNPYISCQEGDFDPKLPMGAEDVVFHNTVSQPTDPLTFYIKRSDGGYITVDSKCSFMRKYLAVDVPHRRFSATANLPTTNLTPYACDTTNQPEQPSSLAERGWNLWRVEPESGWKIGGGALTDSCSTGQADAHVGALVVSYTEGDKTRFLPIVSVDGCYLNRETWYQNAQPVASREASVRQKLGLPSNAVAKVLPPELKAEVEMSPFFEICTDAGSSCQAKQYYFNYSSKELVEVSSEEDRSVADIDGSTKYNWGFSRADQAASPQGAYTSVTFPACHLGAGSFVAAIGLAGADVAGIQMNNTNWYARMEQRRREFFVKTIDSKTELTLPCFTAARCTLTASNESELRGALRGVGCEMGSVEEGFKAQTLRVLLSSDIQLTRPIVVDGAEQVQQDRGYSVTLKDFETVEIMSEGEAKTISGGFDCKDFKFGLRADSATAEQRAAGAWCQDIYRAHKKIPLIAARYMNRNLKLNNVRFEASAENMTAIYSHGSVVSMEQVTVEPGGANDENSFDRAFYARHGSELYIQDSSFVASHAVGTVLASRLAMKDSSLNAGVTGQGLFAGTNSEVFLYKSQISGQSPVLIKGAQLDLEAGDTAGNRQLEAHESQFIGLNMFDSKNCIDMKWGPHVLLDQIQFKQCESAVTFSEYVTNTLETPNAYKDSTIYPLLDNAQMKAELFLPYYASTRVPYTMGEIAGFIDEDTYTVTGQ